jgi:hypothetical protein
MVPFIDDSAARSTSCSEQLTSLSQGNNQSWSSNPSSHIGVDSGDVHKSSPTEDNSKPCTLEFDVKPKPHGPRLAAARFHAISVPLTRAELPGLDADHLCGPSPHSTGMLPLNPNGGIGGDGDGRIGGDGDGGVGGDEDASTDNIVQEEDDFESMFLSHDEVYRIAAPLKTTQDVVTQDSFGANSSNESGCALIVAAPLLS